MSNAASAGTSPLSIAVVGVGRIGSAFAYQLSKAGHHVTVVARPGSRRVAQLRRDRGVLRTTGERAESPLSTISTKRSPSIW